MGSDPQEGRGWTNNSSAAWGGVVSRASYDTGNAGADFGNTFYNDHHFHYGYFVNAAALIGYMDPSWIPKNKDYVNMLARDYANPSSKDSFFPPHRNFDPWHGHSWAHGLFESADGKASPNEPLQSRGQDRADGRIRTKNRVRKTPWRRTGSRCGAWCRVTRTWQPGRRPRPSPFPQAELTGGPVAGAT